MAGRILILRWTGSAYDSLGGLLEQTAQELAAMGHRVLLFTAGGQDWPHRLAALLQQGDIAFALSMSGIGIDLVLQGKGLLWEATKVPMFNWSCDHPCYYPVRHGIRNRFLLHGYVFPDHARYNIRHLNPNGMAFGVHIGMPPRSMFASAPLPLAERNGRIIFSKSGTDTNAIEANWRERVPVIRQILFDAAEELFHRSTGDFVPVLDRVGERRGLLLDGNNELTLMLIRELDAYIRFRRGNLVMQALLDYPVDVFGTGWDHIKWDGARAVFHGAQPWRPTLQQLPSYLGCLSINPLVQHSVHDRVFFAIAAGVAPISDSNAFSLAHLPDLECYCFDFHSERIVQAVEAVLADPVEAVARTEAAWQALTPDFTMRRAAEQIVQFASLHGTNARCAA
ncbi:MAG TPA: glycosyltransferase [Acetobacteraceae bacterium]|nr:glycosyltransferase [Acetobacteraceae bacterium]